MPIFYCNFSLQGRKYISAESTVDIVHTLPQPLSWFWSGSVVLELLDDIVHVLGTDQFSAGDDIVVDISIDEGVVNSVHVVESHVARVLIPTGELAAPPPVVDHV